MSHVVSRISGDRAPVTGGISPPARALRPITVRTTAVPTDALGKHILRLLTLHRDISLKFRGIDLSAMDDAAKRALLDDTNSVLGIKPIKPPAV